MSPRSCRNPAVEPLEGRTLLSTATAHPARAVVEVYRVRLDPLNESGVTGRGLLFRVSDGWFGPYRGGVRLVLNGLDRGVAHAADLAGYPYLLPPGVCPPASAAADDPSPAGLGDSILSAGEAERYTGATVAELPPVRVRGRIGLVAGTFQGVNDPRDSLADVLLVRGLTVAGQDQPTVPVACGTLTFVGSRRI